MSHTGASTPTTENNRAEPAQASAPAGVQMDIHQVLATLPHRYPFILVDRVLELRKGEYVRALKNVTINEPFFPGHFPIRPVMPGVLQLEALAQAAAMLAFATTESKPNSTRVVYLVGIDNARFKRVVQPGDQLILEAWLERMRAGVHRYRTKASVQGQIAVECEIMCTERDDA